MASPSEFARRLEVEARAPIAKAKGVLKKGAVNIKNQLQAEASRSTHFKIAKAINFTIEENEKSVSAEIGPDKRYRVARIANIAYFGGARGGGRSLPDPRNALEKEAAGFEKWLAKIAGDEL